MTTSHTDNKDIRNENPLEIVNQKEVGKAALSLDVGYYQSFLDDTDIPDEKKQELIETIWSIVTSFVDLGFGIHPVQQAKNQKTKFTPIVSADAAGLEEEQPTNKRKDA